MAQYEESIHKVFDRIKKSKLNAYISLNEHEAIKIAKEVDEGKITGPLAGMPVGVKDCITTKGIQTTCGSKILTGYVPPFNAEVVDRIRKAGAVIIGKTNMDEFAMGSSTESSHYGVTKNPWDLARVAGGSSGGSGAAVAGLECRMALGTDTGGSVRCPAILLRRGRHQADLRPGVQVWRRRIRKFAGAGRPDCKERERCGVAFRRHRRP